MQVIARVPVVVQSPLRSPLVTEDAPENFVRLPEAGEPVVVTVPVPVPAQARVPVVNVHPAPTVTFENPPDPLP